MTGKRVVWCAFDAARWEEAMRLLVVGAGSTGGYFGGRLAQAGRDVTFLVRPNRAADLQANGLQILSPHGNFTFTPKLVTASDLAAAGGIDLQFDAILLTVKSYALEAALADLAPAVGPDTMILPTLNGMRHVDVITARFRQAGACRLRLPDRGQARRGGPDRRAWKLPRA